MSHNQGLSRYDQVILTLFEHLRQLYGDHETEYPFDKELLDRISEETHIKNVPDIIYSFRSGRRPFPDAMRALGHWVIKGAGRGKYILARLEVPTELSLPDDLAVIEIPDATPDVVLRYAKGDEQSVLVQVRYNRLVDVFTGLTAYHLQSHVRSFVAQLGQVEIDDLYFGVNTLGEWFCLPVEAKSAGPDEQLGRVQVSSMVAYVRQEFPELVVRPIGVKMMADGSIFLVEFTADTDPAAVRVRLYQRYHLVRQPR